MQGKQVLTQPLFTTLDLNAFVPATHRLRKIDKILDLDFIYELTRPLYSATHGRPAIDPVLFFRLQILKHFYGIDSDRQLCEDVHVNLAHRWFLRLALHDSVPDHSALTRIRDRFGEDLFREVFERIVEQCRAAGLVKGRQLVTDSTLFRANATRDKVVPRDGVRVEGPSPMSADASTEETATEDETEEAPQKKNLNDTYVSTTDPDATIVAFDGVPRNFYYKAHNTIDGSSRVLIDCHVTTGRTHECTVFNDRARYQMDRFDLSPDEWLADTGYGTGSIYSFCEANDIVAFIPVRDRKGTAKSLPGSDFQFDRSRNIYICPQGHILHPNKPRIDRQTFRVTDGGCKSCPVRSSCLKETSRGYKQVSRAIQQHLFEDIFARRQTDLFRERMRERSWKIEGVHAELKNRQGLWRATVRGRAKVQIQAYLCGIVHNLKRLAQAVFVWLSTVFLSFEGRLRLVVAVVTKSFDLETRRVFAVR